MDGVTEIKTRLAAIEERVDTLFKVETVAPVELAALRDQLVATLKLAIAGARITLNLLAKVTKDRDEVAAITEELNASIDPLEKWLEGT